MYCLDLVGGALSNEWQVPGSIPAEAEIFTVYTQHREQIGKLQLIANYAWER